MRQETLQLIAEDVFLTAAKIRVIDPDYCDEEGNLDYYRLAEIVVNLGERIVDLCGIDHETVWMPDDITDMVDGNYGAQRV